MPVPPAPRALGLAAVLLLGPAVPTQAAQLEPSSRASAATALGLKIGSEAVPTLLPLLHDRDDSVRMAAARALGRLGGAQARQALEDQLCSEDSPLVREALQQGLTFTEP